PTRRRLALHTDRLLGAAVIETSIEAQCAESRVTKDALLARVFHDRDKLWTKPARAAAQRQRCRERRDVGAERARRLVEPVREERRHVGLAREHERVAIVAA